MMDMDGIIIVMGVMIYWDRKLSYCHFVHHKSHTHFPPPWEAGDICPIYMQFSLIL
jgi:hypothetical protein